MACWTHGGTSVGVSVGVSVDSGAGVDHCMTGRSSSGCTSVFCQCSYVHVPLSGRRVLNFELPSMRKQRLRE
jgi:hypothetical protein